MEIRKEFHKIFRAKRGFRRSYPFKISELLRNVRITLLQMNAVKKKKTATIALLVNALGEKLVQTVFQSRK